MSGSRSGELIILWRGAQGLSGSRSGELIILWRGAQGLSGSGFVGTRFGELIGSRAHREEGPWSGGFMVRRLYDVAWF